METSPSIDYHRMPESSSRQRRNCPKWCTAKNICGLAGLGIAIWWVWIMVNNSSSKKASSTSMPQPTSTIPSSTPNITTTLSPSLFERRICPDNETLQELFSQRAFHSQTTNADLLSNFAWTKIAIDQDLVFEDCIRVNRQDCVSSVRDFKRFCKGSHKYI